MTVEIGSELVSQVYAYFLVFCRLGTAFMSVPGIGETAIPRRTRLAAALAVSLAATPAVGNPQMPAEPMGLAGALLAEIAAGALLGNLTRFLLAAMHVAGGIMSQTMVLSNVFGPSVGFGRASSVGGIYLIGGMVAIFASGLHMPMIAAFIESYELIPPATFPSPEDMASVTSEAVATMFRLAGQLAMPFLTLGFLAHASLAIINKSMQNFPVFFVGIPALILGGLTLLVIVTPAVIEEFLSEFESFLTVLRG